MTKIGLAGDWHGNARWAAACLVSFSEQGIHDVYQLGDFGLWPGNNGKMYLEFIKNICAELKMRLWIVPGNHEDYTQIVDPETEDGFVPNRQVLGSGEDWEVSVLPRGYKWTVGDRSFIALGGAPSIDFTMRNAGRDWWPQEMIRESDLARLEEADVMLCHDTSNHNLTDAVRGIVEVPYHLSGWDIRGLVYAAKGRDLLDKAVRVVQPKLLCHGHYHVADETMHDNGTRTVSLGTDGILGNLAVLDTETLEIIFPTEF